MGTAHEGGRHHGIGEDFSIGTQLAVSAPPDGYTLLLVANTVAVNPSLAPKLPYDTLTDLVPVSLVGQTPQVLLVTLSLPATTLPELIALAKSKPNVLNYGSTGVGTTAHMAGALLNLMAAGRVLKFLRAEIDQYARVVNAAGLKAELAR